jgi:hypothetical protein
LNSHVNRPLRAFDSGTFLILCLYMVILLAVAASSLLGEGTAAARFVQFDDFFISLALAQTLFGVFFFALARRTGTDALAEFLNCLAVFLVAMPFVLVAACASATPWHAALVVQLLVFAVWSVAVGLREILSRAPGAGRFYIPVFSIAFFALPVIGRIAEGFSGRARLIGDFSIPGIVLAWSRSVFFASNAWFGTALILAGFLLWARKLLLRGNVGYAHEVT